MLEEPNTKGPNKDRFIKIVSYILSFTLAIITSITVWYELQKIIGNYSLVLIVFILLAAIATLKNVQDGLRIIVTDFHFSKMWNQFTDYLKSPNTRILGNASQAFMKNSFEILFKPIKFSYYIYSTQSFSPVISVFILLYSNTIICSILFSSTLAFNFVYIFIFCILPTIVFLFDVYYLLNRKDSFRILNTIPFIWIVLLFPYLIIIIESWQLRFFNILSVTFIIGIGFGVIYLKNLTINKADGVVIFFLFPSLFAIINLLIMLNYANVVLLKEHVEKVSQDPVLNFISEGFVFWGVKKSSSDSTQELSTLTYVDSLPKKAMLDSVKKNLRNDVPQIDNNTFSTVSDKDSTRGDLTKNDTDSIPLADSLSIKETKGTTEKLNLFQSIPLAVGICSLFGFLFGFYIQISLGLFEYITFFPAYCFGCILFFFNRPLGIQLLLFAINSDEVRSRFWPGEKFLYKRIRKHEASKVIEFLIPQVFFTRRHKSSIQELSYYLESSNHNQTIDLLAKFLPFNQFDSFYPNLSINISNVVFEKLDLTFLKIYERRLRFFWEIYIEISSKYTSLEYALVSLDLLAKANWNKDIKSALIEVAKVSNGLYHFRNQKIIEQIFTLIITFEESIKIDEIIQAGYLTKEWHKLGSAEKIIHCPGRSPLMPHSPHSLRHTDAPIVQP